METPLLDTEIPARAMAVIPHPDDGEVGCGGTLANWISGGCQVVYVVCTNGDKGSNNPKMTSDILPGIRQQEQLNAAKAIGVQEVVFLGHPDGGLEDTTEFRGELVREIRRHRPEVVLTTDPFRRTPYLHRDHRLTGQVTLDAVFPYARDHLHYPEHFRDLGLLTHKVSRVFLWGTEEPDLYIDITSAIDCKIAALKHHVSQMPTPSSQVNDFVRKYSKEAGEAVDVPYAEAFRCHHFRQ